MQAGRLFSIPVAASILTVLVAAAPGTPEASRRFGNSPALLSSPHAGFDASRSLPDDGAHSQLRTALRLGRAKDTDGDGVGDRQDACPETPLTAIVDTSGCPTDQDQDGVFDGRDPLPALQGKAASPHSALHWIWNQGRKEQWQGMREGDYKLLRATDSGPWQLFDLSEDVGEQTDLAAQQRAGGKDQHRSNHV